MTEMSVPGLESPMTPETVTIFPLLCVPMFSLVLDFFPVARCMQDMGATCSLLILSDESGNCPDVPFALGLEAEKLSGR